MTMQTINTHPDVVEAATKYEQAKAALPAARQKLVAEEQVCAKTQAEAEKVAVRAELGEATQEEARAAKRAASDASEKVTRLQADMQVKEQAFGILRERLQEARESARGDLLTTYRKEQEALVRRVAEKLDELATVNGELQELEQSAANQSIKLTELALRDISPAFKGMMGAGSVRAWKQRVHSTNYINLNRDAS